MKTLKISISEADYNEFGFIKNNMTFTEFIDIVNREMIKQNMKRSLELASKYILSADDDLSSVASNTDKELTRRYNLFLEDSNGKDWEVFKKELID